jgi:uncharacterized protein DUF3168
MTITMHSPITAIQKVIVAILRADATLAGLLAPIKGITPATPAVVDQPPEGQTKPYIRVGDNLSIPDHDHTSAGREVTVTLHVWTKERSSKPGQTIADRVTELLDHQVASFSAALEALGHRCVSIRQEFDQALEDPDPEIRHHVLRFRVQTQQLT